VVVVNGNVDAALKALKRELATSDTLALFRSDSVIHAYQRPALRKKIKRLRARARVRRSQRRAAWYEARVNPD
jgi:ribosomal protein S21